MQRQLNLTFLSTRFLLPADSGGKIRTTQVLRGLKGGSFRVTLLMPSRLEARRDFEKEIPSLCDELITWEPRPTSRLTHALRKASWLARREPIPVINDWSLEGAAAVEGALARDANVVVFDFPHSAVLHPARMTTPSVMFTHNIEAEIFHRHLQVARTPLHRFVWRNQFEKMRRYEIEACERFDMIVAVSERDRDFFLNDYRLTKPCRTIPTGVDTEFFRHHLPRGEKQVVFCGSMDWLANIDAIEFFFDSVWPAIRRDVPDARMRVVGRTPPAALVRRICSAAPEWEFTGFVDDIRNYVEGADAFVIPLRVGGGTRIKAFEAMAMGAPVVSTAIGVEGLPMDAGVHYLAADAPLDFAAQVVSLLRDRRRGNEISLAARDLVQERYGFRRVAREFERICLETIALKGREPERPASR